MVFREGREMIWTVEWRVRAAVFWMGENESERMGEGKGWVERRVQVYLWRRTL